MGGNFTADGEDGDGYDTELLKNESVEHKLGSVFMDKELSLGSVNGVRFVQVVLESRVNMKFVRVLEMSRPNPLDMRQLSTAFIILEDFSEGADVQYRRLQ